MVENELIFFMLSILNKCLYYKGVKIVPILDKNNNELTINEERTILQESITSTMKKKSKKPVALSSKCLTKIMNNIITICEFIKAK